MTAKQKETPLTFEKAMARLEDIVADMEGGELSLDRMMARFEEGNRLIAFCGCKLDEVEKKIEILVKEGDGVRAEPFGGAEADEEDGGRKE